MCPDTEHLLSIVDGPAPAELAQHVRDCDACRRELAALKAQREMLRALPQVQAPPFSAALMRRPSSGAGRRWALAASVAAVGMLGLWMALSPQTPSQGLVAETVTPAPVARTDALRAEIKAEIKALTRRSAQLERQWQFLNRNAPRVRRVAHEVNTAPLKSGLMQLDARYADLPEPKYWRQRVQLLDTLVTLEQTERLVRNDPRLGASPALVRTL